MGKRIAGTFNGTGAALYVGIGFIPDFVRLVNVEDSETARLEWNVHMSRCDEMTEGLMQHDDETTAPDALTVADGGIRPFRGGNLVASASTSYLVKDDKDYRTSVTYGTINTWTLGSSANRTGNFNLEADTTYVGVGSRICIKESFSGDVIWASIIGFTSNGEQANEVELSESVASGTILFIGNMYDYTGAPANTIMPAGFSLHLTTDINVSGEMVMFEAGNYDN